MFKRNLLILVIFLVVIGLSVIIYLLEPLSTVYYKTDKKINYICKASCLGFSAGENLNSKCYGIIINKYKDCSVFYPYEGLLQPEIK